MTLNNPFCRRNVYIKYLFILAVILFGAAQWLAAPAYSKRRSQPVAASPIPLNERVLVVYNKNVPESLDVANYYLSRRGIPQSNRCSISPPDTTSVDWSIFDSTIKTPIKNCLNAAGRDRILYIVFAYQTPFRIEGVPIGNEGQARALDQFIADIWDEYDPDNSLFIEHPYYGAAQSQGNAYPPFVSLADYRAQSSAKNIYSVWRLDAASADLAKGLVDKAIQAETNGLSGQACLDRNRGDISYSPDTGYLAADWDLHRAADFAGQAFLPVTEDANYEEFGTPPAPVRCDNAALYSGWYSFNNYNDAFTWNTGAIGFHLDSASASNPRGGPNWSANALMKGITVTSGAVSEPYLEGLPHADGVFRNLFQGANVGDAFLRNTAYLRWMILNMGDPLYRPFPSGLAPFNSPSYRETSLSLDPQFIIGGNSSLGTVTLSSPAPQGGATITLTHTASPLVNIPESVIVLEGATTATFTISTNPTPIDTLINVTASYNATSISNIMFVSARYEGFHDVADCNIISGWAWDRTQPNNPISVDIYDGNKLLATVQADNFRQDVLNQGYGNGYHGFSYTTPANLKDGQSHSISVKFTSSSDDLSYTPKTISCLGSPTPNPTPSPTPTPTPIPTPTPGVDIVWIEDAVPASAALAGDSEGWNWITSNPAAYSGTAAHQSNVVATMHQHYFYGATNTLTINTGDTLVAYVYLDPQNMPSEVMLQWNDGTWEHRAYWGANNINFGVDATISRRYMGVLPASGQWIRLEVPANQVGLEGHTLNGMAFTLYGGRATWDHAGKTTAQPTPTPAPTPTPNPSPTPLPTPGADFTWIEDEVPAGATTYADADGWNWVGSNPSAYSGVLAHQSTGTQGLHQHYFIGASNNMAVNPGDTLVAYVYLDPASPPSEVMLQWNDGSWEHRAYWGANNINWGSDGTNSRRFVGQLAAAGQWARLEVSANQVGLGGRAVNGMAFTLYGGRATWDHAGKSSGTTPAPTPTPAPGTDTVWVEDALPAGSSVAGDAEAWAWLNSSPAAYSGTLAHQSNTVAGEHQHYFYGATSTLTINTGDKLVAYVYLDPANIPSEIMLQWNDGSWEHRAYWGANKIGWGVDGTISRQRVGPLPTAGQWLRLEVPASQVGLEGRTINGMAFTLYGGRATWDHAGKSF